MVFNVCQGLLSKGCLGVGNNVCQKVVTDIISRDGC